MSNISKITDCHCYGCGICQIVCSEGGVNLRIDEDGYYKSQIDENKCINCGKCLSVCPYFAEPNKLKLSPSYVAYCKNEEYVIRSSSGGLGYIIAEKYLEMGYTIIGAAWSSDKRRVEHVVVNNKKELNVLRKSKYVQSYTVDAFKQINSLEKVVVFGTPCQIAGLRRLYDDKKDLILIDFDCMGPAGLNLWNKYIDYIQDKNTSGIKSIEMRHKKKSWMMYGTQVVFNDGSVYYQDKFHDPFCVLYHMARSIQQTCLEQCKFLNASMADLRIGDGWNYTDEFTKRQIRNGLSLITPQTEKGKEIIKSIADQVVLHEVHREFERAKEHSQQTEIMDYLQKSDVSIMDAVKIYNSVGFVKKVIRSMSHVLSINDMVYLLIKRILKKCR